MKGAYYLRALIVLILLSVFGEPLYFYITELSSNQKGILFGIYICLIIMGFVFTVTPREADEAFKLKGSTASKFWLLINIFFLIYKLVQVFFIYYFKLETYLNKKL